MLTITTKEQMVYIEDLNKFKKIKSQTLQLEHSLISLWKWESKWKRPYLGSKKTQEEMIDYIIRCMPLVPIKEPLIIYALSEENVNQIAEYILDPMTCSKVNNKNVRNDGKYVSAETVYYQMISLNIPFECEKWHLNRLLALISYCAAENEAANKKMPRKETLKRYNQLNKARRNPK